MNDRELITLAAKAADIQGSWELDTNFRQERWYFNVPYDNHGMLSCFEWNPLREDGDAFRLMISLELQIEYDNGQVLIGDNNLESFSTDKYAATRRALVRAAAEIGKNLADNSACVSKASSVTCVTNLI